MDWDYLCEALRHLLAFNNDDDPGNETLKLMIEAIKEGRVKIVAKAT